MFEWMPRNEYDTKGNFKGVRNTFGWGVEAENVSLGIPTFHGCHRRNIRHQGSKQLGLMEAKPG